MKLSADKVNEASPYWVIALDELSFRFRTENGVVYVVGFYPDKLFYIKGAYHFYIRNANKKHVANDPKVFQVITAVIEEFFRQNPLVMLYICDPRDNRQAARNRLYQHWFEGYINHSEFRLYSESVVYKSVDYYAGLIMRKDNPYYEEVVATFHDVVGFLPAQMVGNKS